MRRAGRRAVLAAVAAAMAAQAAMSTAALAAEADLILWGGPIHTAEESSPRVEAVAVDGGRIVHAGDRAGAERLRGPGTLVVELRGAALYPGFTDAHAHLRGIGEREITLNLEGTPSLAALVEKVAARAKEAPAGAVVSGRGWIETHWPEKRFPTRQDLDRAAPDRPVILVRADGHALVANSAALKAAGITAATTPPAGGDILRDGRGEPTGMLIDAAMGLVRKLEAEPSEAERRRAYAIGAEVYAAQGWTGLHNMGIELEDVALLEAMAGEGKLPIRVYNSVARLHGERLVAAGPRASADGMVVTRSVKLYVDGALGSRGAALLEPYADAGGRGLLLAGREELMPFLEQALRRGIQVNTHAIGDRANRLVLDWYEAAFRAVPPAERAVAEPRWRVEHAQVIDAADIPRFKALGVIPSMQPSHAIGDLHFAPARLGEARLAGAYAWRALVEGGNRIAAGSDAPVERGDPRIEFYAAVARKDLKGFQGPGWHPEQAVDRATALKMLTLWPAAAAFQDQELGSIAVGKRADLTVFSADLMAVPEAEILAVRPLLTVVDGKVRFRAEGW
ncbi:MAG TPA: amidohydrolase [Azospirillaceae bacterium]|nr:amidohydrolase [Azospirillaceae bacterium]